MTNNQLADLLESFEALATSGHSVCVLCHCQGVTVHTDDCPVPKAMAAARELRAKSEDGKVDDNLRGVFS